MWVCLGVVVWVLEIGLGGCIMMGVLCMYGGVGGCGVDARGF